MKKPRVAICTFDAPGFTGGPNSWLRRWSAFVTVRGFEVRVLAFILNPHAHRIPDDYPLLAALAAQGIGFVTFPHWETIEKKLLWLLAQLEALQPSVFIPNFVIAGLYATAWTRPAGLPTVGVLHSDDDYHRALVDRFVAGPARFRPTDIVTVSRYLTVATQAQAAPETSVWGIPYGVPLPATTAQWTQGPLRLLYAGRLEEEQKRISDVTRALCRAAQLPNVTATIAGDGRGRAAVERIIAQESHGRVRYVGLVDNARIQALMAEHHVFVLLSDYEGLPIALMEAMAAGLVPICTPMRSGIGELVVDGETGLIVPDRGDGFVAAVARLAGQPETWARLAQGARRQITTSGYDLETCHRQWLDLLDRRNREATYQGQPLLRRRSRRLGLPPPHPNLEEDHWREPPPLVYYGRVARAKLIALTRRLWTGRQPASP
ncbi:glycosyltransferase family 4 protein [Chloracidobacterium validum]|uniref:Glycosyltransferase family 4 protein n=1 Tax=Chloracidobacterium validum TaxID=2821543 RepID=A0ABX8B9P2_9BACT|nr:glycosyltransferase family 4 protein [Chloracidobacterium validum]QUW03654.1 glycosyltransferase family 4 protein [Chloracidobacterium validum]